MYLGTLTTKTTIIIGDITSSEWHMARGWTCWRPRSGRCPKWHWSSFLLPDLFSYVNLLWGSSRFCVFNFLFLCCSIKTCTCHVSVLI
jgi:hypothetical protein